MKNFLLISLSLVILICFTSCKKKQEVEIVNNPTTNPTSKTQWIIYNNTNTGLDSHYLQAVSSIAVDAQSRIWIGGYYGILKFDGTNWTAYNNVTDVNNIAIDSKGNKWIGARFNLYKYDNTSWTDCGNGYNNIYRGGINLMITIDKQDNIWAAYEDYYCYSGTDWGYPVGIQKFNGSNWSNYAFDTCGGNYWVSLIVRAVDLQGNIWIGNNHNIIKFDGVRFTSYHDNNSILYNYGAYVITIDGNGNKWIGTGVGLVKFDGTSWTIYTPDNSGLPNNTITAIAIDSQGNKWIGTEGGFAKFDGTNWTTYNYLNSSLPSNNITALAIDAHGNKWIGTDEAVVVYNENGVVLK